MKIDVKPLKKYVDMYMQVMQELKAGIIKAEYTEDGKKHITSSSGLITYEVYDPSGDHDIVCITDLEMDDTGEIIVHYSNGDYTLESNWFNALFRPNWFINDKRVRVDVVPLNPDEYYTNKELRKWILDVTKQQAALLKKVHDKKIENSTDLYNYQRRLGYEPLFMIHRDGVVGLYTYDSEVKKFRLAAITKNLRDTLSKNNYDVQYGGYCDWINYRSGISATCRPELLKSLLVAQDTDEIEQKWLGFSSEDEETEFFEFIDENCYFYDYYYWVYDTPKTIADNEIYTGKNGVISDFIEFGHYLAEYGIEDIYMEKTYETSIYNKTKLYIWGMQHEIINDGIYLNLSCEYKGDLSDAERFDMAVKNRDYKMPHQIIFSFESYVKCILNVLKAGTFGIDQFYHDFDNFLYDNHDFLKTSSPEEIERKFEDEFYVSYEGDRMSIGQCFFEDIKEPIIVTSSSKRYMTELQEKIETADKQMAEKDSLIEEKDEQIKKLTELVKRLHKQLEDKSAAAEEKKTIPKSIPKSKEITPDKFRSALRMTLDAVAPKKFTMHRVKDGKNELVLKTAVEDEHISQFISIMKKRGMSLDGIINSNGFLRKDIAVAFVKFMKKKGYWK